ncbi:MAG: hypothetical protein SXV54_09845 [Chloroflexota bacterium]|nr:hypothetical protein [Chloroflexota bacterium]
MSRKSFPRFFRFCCGLGTLLVAVLACYTSQQAAEAEQRAVAQLDAVLETLDYAPPDAVLLAVETRSDGYAGVESEYVGAGVNRIYGIDRSCEEIVADYETAMLAAGWKRRGDSECNHPVWLWFYLESGEDFIIYAEPFEGANIEVDESEAQRFQTTYFVNLRVRIPME